MAWFVATPPVLQSWEILLTGETGASPLDQEVGYDMISQISQSRLDTLGHYPQTLATTRRFLSLLVGCLSLAAMLLVGNVGFHLCNFVPEATFQKAGLLSWLPSICDGFGLLAFRACFERSAISFSFFLIYFLQNIAIIPGSLGIVATEPAAKQKLIGLPQCATLGAFFICRIQIAMMIKPSWHVPWPEKQGIKVQSCHEHVQSEV